MKNWMNVFVNERWKEQNKKAVNEGRHDELNKLINEWMNEWTIGWPNEWLNE